jgi:HK97 family phage prohead protease
VENEQPVTQEQTPFTFHRSFVTPEVKAVNTDKREVLHLISTVTEDRAGDIVEPSGANVANYMKNPVVLADHNYSIGSIIGRNTSLEVTKEGLWARTQFHKEGLGRDAFNLVKEGFARAWSIGFRPIVFDSRKDEKGKQLRGFHFKEWELLEYSLVAIPMNPDAVMNAVKCGIVSESNVTKLLLETAESVTPEPEKPADAARHGANAEPKRKEYDPQVLEALHKWARGLSVGLAIKHASKEGRK